MGNTALHEYEARSIDIEPEPITALARDIFVESRSQGPRRLLKALPKPTLTGCYKMCEKFWTVPPNSLNMKNVINTCLGKFGYVIKRKEVVDCLMRELNEQREILNHIKIPPIFICTLPKSGSVFLHTALANSLKVDVVRIDTAGFPESLYDRELLFKFTEGNCIAQAHLPAIPVNIGALLLSLDKFVLHIRDPRSALVSWMNFATHFNKQVFSESVSPQHSPYLGVRWTNASFEEQFEIAFSFFYKECLLWLQQWFSILKIDWKESRKDFYSVSSQQFYDDKKLSFLPKKEMSIMLTTHEDMVRNGEDSLISRILKFYDIPPCFYRKVEIRKDMSSHFRSGKTDSWKSELTPEQQRKVTELLPIEWCSFFGWDESTAR